MRPTGESNPTRGLLPRIALLAITASLLVACGAEPIRQRSELGILYRQTWIGGRYAVRAQTFTGELEATRDVSYSLRFSGGRVVQSGEELAAGTCLRSNLAEGAVLRFEVASEVRFSVPPDGCR
jgi:hypothetical protein